MKQKSLYMSQCSLFIALNSILSQVFIPIPLSPIPINLTLISVLNSGVLLGAKNGLISQILYLLLGAMGIPIFSKFSGGMGTLLGPTGGYIFSYPFVSLFVGCLANVIKPNLFRYILIMACGLIICYLFGASWFMYTTKCSLVDSIFICILPFLLGDIIKIIVSAMISFKIKAH